MDEDIFEKIDEVVDFLENIYGADLSNMCFNIAEEYDDLERWLRPKMYRWTKKKSTD